MEFLDGIRWLFDEKENQQTIESMGKGIAQKLKHIEDFKHEVEVLDLAVMSYKMQNFQLAKILKIKLYCHEFNSNLYSCVQKIWSQTAQMRFLLGRVEWDKIKKYDEIPFAEHNKIAEKRIQENKDLADKMEKRQIVQKLRAVQSSQHKLLEIMDMVKEEQKKMQKNFSSKVEEALNERNQAIVKIILKAKEIEDLRLKVEEIDKTADSLHTVEIQSNIVLKKPKSTIETVKEEQQAASSNGDLPEENVFKKPQEPPLVVQKTSEQLRVMLATKFDFGKLKPRKSEHLNDKKEILTPKENLCSILRKPNQNQVKITKRVTIVSPSPSLTSIDSRESFLTFQPIQEANETARNAEKAFETQNSEKTNNSSPMSDLKEQSQMDTENATVNKSPTAEMEQDLRQSTGVETNVSNSALDKTYALEESLLATNATDNLSSSPTQPTAMKPIKDTSIVRGVSLRWSMDTNSSEDSQQTVKPQSNKPASFFGLSDEDMNEEAPFKDENVKTAFTEFDFGTVAAEGPSNDFFDDFSTTSRRHTKSKFKEDLF